MTIRVHKSISVKYCLSALVVIVMSLHQGNALADQQQLMSIDNTRHLLQRSGFALPPAAIIEKSKRSIDQLLLNVMQNTQPICPIKAPAWTRTPPAPRPDYKSMSKEQRKTTRRAQRKIDIDRLRELQYWWLSNLVASKNPLGARMVLFWQNHFTTEHRKVRSSQLIYDQHALLQQHALGNFAELLTAILKDPAMLIYLDNRSNVKSNPNENLARELFELHTLGEGNYNENDVKAAARALTGYGVSRDLKFRYRKNRHDNDEKIILDKTANHNMQSLIGLLLAEPATAELIVKKLWREFVSLEPDQQSIKELAQVFREANFEIKPLLTAIFQHPAFWAPENRGVLIKSPAHFVSDTLRVWQLNIIKPARLLNHMQYMEQTLFNPPNVKGWPGGYHWVNGNTLLARNTFVQNLLRSANDRRGIGPNNGMGLMQTPTNMTAPATTRYSPMMIKAALIGSQSPLQNREQLASESVLQDLLTEPSWQLY